MVVLQKLRSLSALAVLASLSLVLAGAASAQFDGGFTPTFPGDAAGGDAAGGDRISLKASFEVAQGSSEGRLHVDATLQPSWHVYSVTQAEGGPIPTKITLADGSQAVLTGPFVPDHDPKRSQSPLYPGLTLEEHEEEVRWTAPLKFADGVKPEQAKVIVEAKGLTCQADGLCQPFGETLTAKMSGSYKPVKAASSFREEEYVVQWQASIEPQVARAGETVQLSFTAIPDPEFHVYPAAVDDRNFATNFVITRQGPLAFEKPVASEEPVTVTKDGGPPSVHHEGPVTWTIEVKIPPDAATGAYPIEGFVAYQACTSESCLLPQALQFSTQVRVADEAQAAAGPVALTSARRAVAMDAFGQHPWPEAASAEIQPAAEQAASEQDASPVIITSDNQDSNKKYSFPVLLGFGLLAGLILNLMPCVLPVLGLKLMSLTDQAGQDRRQILMTNIWYSLGVLTVFWILAATVAIFSLSWGELNTYFEFKFGITLVLFALSLSFLGVWEIPTPGIATGKFSQDLQHVEGPVGSYSKGLFTTLIATPCGGPFLGLVLSLLIGTSTATIFTVFTAMGIGMALPFLMVGISPRLVSLLPKPGNWMEILKQCLAFVLLLTVAFFFSWFSAEDKVPVFISMIGVWFACWLIGKVPLWAPMRKQLLGWGTGIACVAVVSYIAFNLPGGYEINTDPDSNVTVAVNAEGEVEGLVWQAYDEARLKRLQAEGKTVLLEFTAAWCVNCKYNMAVAIDTKETARLVKELDVVPMVADWTDQNPQIKQKLLELNSNAIPLLVVYPGRAPDQPIVMRDILRQKDVTQALQLAGASLTAKATDVAVASTEPIAENR